MMIPQVENCVTKGYPLTLSRRTNVPLNVYVLAEAGYLEIEDVGEKLLYRWADQFPVMVRWERSPDVRTYNPGAVVHVQTKNKENVVRDALQDEILKLHHAD